MIYFLQSPKFPKFDSASDIEGAKRVSRILKETSDSVKSRSPKSKSYTNARKVNQAANYTALKAKIADRRKRKRKRK